MIVCCYFQALITQKSVGTVIYPPTEVLAKPNAKVKTAHVCGVSVLFILPGWYVKLAIFSVKNKSKWW
jgi:hypothetical protein